MGYTYKEANEIIDRFRPSHLWEKKKINGKETGNILSHFSNFNINIYYYYNKLLNNERNTNIHSSKIWFKKN